MVISSVLKESYCGLLTRINQLFISVIIPMLPQEEPRGHAGWAHTMGTPRLVASGGESKHGGEAKHRQVALAPSPHPHQQGCQRAGYRILCSAWRRSCPVGVRMPHCTMQEGPGPGSRSYRSSVLSAGSPGKMANPQVTQGTASGSSQEGHQGRPAATEPMLTNPASSAKGLGATRCRDLASRGQGARRHPAAEDELGTAEGQPWQEGNQHGHGVFVMAGDHFASHSHLNSVRFM